MPTTSAILRARLARVDHSFYAGHLTARRHAQLRSYLLTQLAGAEAKEANQPAVSLSHNRFRSLLRLANQERRDGR